MKLVQQSTPFVDSSTGGQCVLRQGTLENRLQGRPTVWTVRALARAWAKWIPRGEWRWSPTLAWPRAARAAMRAT
jgi:hypothetical protein